MKLTALTFTLCVVCAVPCRVVCRVVSCRCGRQWLQNLSAARFAKELLSQLALQTNTAEEDDKQVVHQILRLKLKGPLYTLWTEALSVVLRNNKCGLLARVVLAIVWQV